MQKGQVRERRVPQIGTDQQAQPPILVDGVGVHEPPLGVVFRLDQLAIGGQVDLAVDVDQPPRLVDPGGIVELRAGPLLDEAHDQDRLARRPAQLQKARIVAAHGHVEQVLGPVMAHHRQFGKD